MNSVALAGRLTRDPEVRYTQSQTAVASFTLAVDRPYSKDKENNADFIRITTFGKQAEFAEKYLNKGRLVGVTGRIQTGSYQDKDGKTVYTTDVIADRIEFLGPASRDGQGGYQGGYQQNGYPSAPRQAAPAPAPSQPPVNTGFTAIEDDDDIPF